MTDGFTSSEINTLRETVRHALQRGDVSILEPKEDMIEPRNQIDHPLHYGGEDNPYEAIKVIEAWGLGFSLGNAVKYISRAGKKDPSKEIEDLKKARWYIDRAIQQREEV